MLKQLKPARITTAETMAKRPPLPPNSNHDRLPEQASKGGNDSVPIAYAESSTNFNGVYAMPAASSVLSATNTMIRITKEQEVALQERGFPPGLSQEVVSTVGQSPVRFWVIDNSGSMWASDGHVLRGKGKNTQLIPCTRWSEMQATVEYHAELSGLLEATTVFQLLNHPGDPRVPQVFSIAEHGYHEIPNNIETAKNAVMNCQPNGPTPLAERLLEIQQQITEIAPSLHSKGQKVVIVLATDGLPTDTYGGSSADAAREFVSILRGLQDYPVWIVVRLCTDDAETCNFYNSLDGELELPLEVLDDHVAESKEVATFNPWLNYGLPIHRTRELGYQHRIFDLLDERPLNKEEVKEFLELLFGKEAFLNAPDVHDDWNAFQKLVARVVKSQNLVWNPRSQKMEPWVDVKKLDKTYGERLSLLKRLGSSSRRKGSTRK